MSLGGKHLVSGAKSGKTNRMIGVSADAAVAGACGNLVDARSMAAGVDAARLKFMFYPKAKRLKMESRFFSRAGVLAGLS